MMAHVLCFAITALYLQMYMQSLDVQVIVGSGSVRVSVIHQKESRVWQTSVLNLLAATADDSAVVP